MKFYINLEIEIEPVGLEAQLIEHDVIRDNLTEMLNCELLYPDFFLVDVSNDADEETMAKYWIKELKAI